MTNTSVKSCFATGRLCTDEKSLVSNGVPLLSVLGDAYCRLEIVCELSLRTTAELTIESVNAEPLKAPGNSPTHRNGHGQVPRISRKLWCARSKQ